MKTLVIAEKPSVARDIARVLGCSKKENEMCIRDRYYEYDIRADVRRNG